MKSNRIGMGRGRGSGYKNLNRVDPAIHSNSARGKKTYSNLVGNKLDKQIISVPFEYQDSHQERVIHSGWEKGNSYRYVLEGTGDVFRELTKPKPHNSYIEEKLTRAEESIKEHQSGRVHPDDSFQYAKQNNPHKFKKLFEFWAEQPTETPEQKIAVILNIEMIEGHFFSAELTIKKLRKKLKG